MNVRETRTPGETETSARIGGGSPLTWKNTPRYRGRIIFTVRHDITRARFYLRVRLASGRRKHFGTHRRLGNDEGVRRSTIYVIRGPTHGRFRG